MDRGERRHNRRVSGYERRALRLMRRAAAEAARLVQLYGGGAAAGEAFRIDQSMPLRRAVDALLKDLHAALLGEVQRGVYREWTVAESEADALAARAEGMYPVREAERAAWRTHRDAAREAFTARRERGLSLSDRVWRVVDGFAREVEAAATDAIGNGTPAERLATTIKQHLNEPNRLYRRVRTPNGKLRLSKAAAAYHPGRGVYRSSFMNARRLAVTETNMAYRAADFERWQQMDFVVGIEIRLSNNHSCKGVPPGTFHDICDELAGRYPKEFKFTGWHPHCRCHAVPILKRSEEMAQPEAQSSNAVTELPEVFKAYVAGNRGRIATAAARGALPYFLRDNFTVAADGTLAARWGGGSFQIGIEKASAAYRKLQKYGWQPEYFDAGSGGFVVVHPMRRAVGAAGKQERIKLEKELRMCCAFAAAGHRVKMLREKAGVSSPDVLIDGVPAELKSTRSANNVVKYARKAVEVQGAACVLFEFECESDALHKELLKLQRDGFKVLYYFKGRRRVYRL